MLGVDPMQVGYLDTLINFHMTDFNGEESKYDRSKSITIYEIYVGRRAQRSAIGCENDERTTEYPSSLQFNFFFRHLCLA
jgi:hypothetical protein